VNENRFSKYLLYALGEIILVVIGILIALSLNNRNEQQKNHEIFLLELDIAFNRALLLNAQNSSYINIENTEIAWIDGLLTHPESFQIEAIPIILHRLNSFSLPSLNELINLKIKDEVYNDNDLEQQLLINDINLFINRFSSNEKTIDKYWGKNNAFGDKLNEWGIPRITAADYTINDIEVTYRNNNPFTVHHYNIINNKLGDQDFYDALIMLRSSKRSLVELLNQISNQVAVFQERLVQYYPSVGTKVLSLGIIGSSLPLGWEQSVPLKYDDELTQWTGIVALKEGEVKFRANDNWGRNWGGNSFPNGNLIGNGADIKVEKGIYMVKVDLIENTYEFQRQE
jgi:hypothetical protein